MQNFNKNFIFFAKHRRR